MSGPRRYRPRRPAAAFSYRTWLVAGLALLFPTVADAHLVQTGFGPFYDGISHLAVSPDDLLLVISLSLLAGLRGRSAGRLVLFTLPAAWLLGGLAGIAWPALDAAPLATSLSLLLIGGLVASDLDLADGLVAGMAVAFGLFHGYLNGAAMRGSGLDVVGLLGIVAAVFIGAALIIAGIVSLRRPWARIVVRVAGSWVVAIGLLMLGWWVRA